MIILSKNLEEKPMKSAYRLLALALVAIMMLGCFAACAETKDPESETTASAETQAPSDSGAAETTESLYDANGYLKSDLPDLDFGGETVTVLWWTDVENPEFFVEETTGDMISDAIFQRNANVEAKLNIKLEWDGIKGQYNNNVGKAYSDHVGNMYASGDSTYDLMSAHSRTIALTAMNGYCADMMDLEYLDFEKPWWPTVMLETATIGDSLYFVTGDVSTNSIHQMYAIFYNKEILSRYPDRIEPSTSVKEGNWTMEAIQILTKDLYQDLDADNKQSANDFYGFTSLNWHFDAIYYGAGLKQAERDEEKLMIISPDYSSEKAANLVDIVGNWVKQGDVFIDSSNYRIPFNSGNALLVMARHHDIAKTITETGFSYGIVPIPKYDTDQESHITVVGNPCSFYSIYTLSEDKDRAAAVLECWASEAYRLTTPAIFEMTMKLRYSETSVESEMYDIIRAGIVFDFGRLFNSSLNAMSDQWDNAAIAGSAWGSLSKRLEKSLSKQFQEIIDNFAAIDN